jgi:hypothetical protein
MVRICAIYLTSVLRGLVWRQSGLKFLNTYSVLIKQIMDAIESYGRYVEGPEKGRLAILRYFGRDFLRGRGYIMASTIERPLLQVITYFLI